MKLIVCSVVNESPRRRKLIISFIAGGQLKTYFLVIEKILLELTQQKIFLIEQVG